ncbi:hypothetical protein BVRB_7g164180 [Beta vulgaris subsp. vulgaris]|nr:hypothetical protein BVRB_7g164180 [Beta vulgaris subsp. vulgaris]
MNIPLLTRGAKNRGINEREGKRCVVASPARHEGGAATHRASGEAPTPAVRRQIAAGPTNRAGTKQRREETRTDGADKGKTPARNRNAGKHPNSDEKAANTGERGSGFRWGWGFLSRKREK